MCDVHPARCILIMIEIPFLYSTIYIPQDFALNQKNCGFCSGKDRNVGTENRVENQPEP